MKPTEHVIGWVVLEIGVNPTGGPWLNLTGSGFRGENPALFADEALAQAEVDAQKTSGTAWIALPVMDQGDDI